MTYKNIRHSQRIVTLLAESILDANYPSDTNYPSEKGNSSRRCLDEIWAKTVVCLILLSAGLYAHGPRCLL